MPTGSQRIATTRTWPAEPPAEPGSLEQRVARLEHEVAELRTILSSGWMSALSPSA